MTHEQLAVTLHGVRKQFPLGPGGTLEVLHIAQLALPVGSVTVLHGPSGAGKTTLLNLIAGITVPTAGTLRVYDTDLCALPEAQRDRFRAQHIGYVFQTFNLLPTLSALDNVMVAMLFTSVIPPRQHRPRARALLARLGLEARLSHKPHQLSRGEQQRVAMARALANNPPLLLADEPCASLDAATAQTVWATLLTVCREDAKTVLLVSHDAAVLGTTAQVVHLPTINRAGAQHTAP